MASPAPVIRLSLQESVQLDRTHFHAAHCFLFAGEEQEMYGLMLMRSDGRVGFPGGGVDEVCPNETDIVRAVNRELMEEINYDARIGLQHHVMSHLHLKVTEAGRSLVTHFFIKRVSSEEEFRRITREHMKGETRSPLITSTYIATDMQKKQRHASGRKCWDCSMCPYSRRRISSTTFPGTSSPGTRISSCLKHWTSSDASPLTPHSLPLRMVCQMLPNICPFLMLAKWKTSFELSFRGSGIRTGFSRKEWGRHAHVMHLFLFEFFFFFSLKLSFPFVELCVCGIILNQNWNQHVERLV